MWQRSGKKEGKSGESRLVPEAHPPIGGVVVHPLLESEGWGDSCHVY